MWHQGFYYNFTELREYFLYAKEKTNTLFTNSSPPRHPSTIFESTGLLDVNSVCCSVSAASCRMFPTFLTLLWFDLNENNESSVTQLTQLSFIYFLFRFGEDLDVIKNVAIINTLFKAKRTMYTMYSDREIELLISRYKNLAISPMPTLINETLIIQHCFHYRFQSSKMFCSNVLL